MSDEILAPTIVQVARLIADQLRDLAAAPVVPLPGSGTTSTILRIGEHHVARFPRRSTSAGAVGAEVKAIRRFRLANASPSPNPSTSAGPATAIGAGGVS